MTAGNWKSIMRAITSTDQVSELGSRALPITDFCRFSENLNPKGAARYFGGLACESGLAEVCTNPENTSIFTFTGPCLK